MSIITKREVKVSAVVAELAPGFTFEQFLEAFKLKYPKDWERVEQEWRRHERKNDGKRWALLSTLDRIHARFGRHEVGVGRGAVKEARRWDMKREALSQAYTTRWDELLEVQA